MLNRIAGQRFHNHSHLDFQKLRSDPDNVKQPSWPATSSGFSRNVRKIFLERFEFGSEIDRMEEANILYLVVSQFGSVNLHPGKVGNEQMGLVFENLIRRFNELANETAGDHFTPREVIRLMVNILFIEDDELLATSGAVRKLLDPACGTGGMLAEAQNYLREHHEDAQLFVYGQDYNPRAFATAASDMLMKEVDHNGTDESVKFGDCLTEDQFGDETFDYFLTNPPFGVDWKKQRRESSRGSTTGWGSTAASAPDSPRERRLAPLPPAHVGQARTRSTRRAQARLPSRHRLQRLAALHRRRGLG